MRPREPITISSADHGFRVLDDALVALGMLSNLLATIRYARIRRAIERGDADGPSAAAVYALGVLATLFGIAMTVMLLWARARH